MLKKTIHFFTIAALTVPHISYAVTKNPALNSLNSVGQQIYGDNRADLKLFIGNIVRVLLGFVGIIFLILIIWGGIEWMTSGGNEERIKSAKKRLLNATIGLIIIVMAYSIASFVVNSLGQAAGGSGSGSGLPTSP